MALAAVGAGMSVIGGLTGIIGGFGKRAEGKRMMREAQGKIAAFQWQELGNAYRDSQVSTLGSDYQMEMAGTTTANMVDASRRGGARGIAANLGRIQAFNTTMGQGIAANLDQQQADLNVKAAAQDMRNQEMVEKRQADELAGYGQMLNVGLGMKHQGLANVAQGFSAMGQGLGNLQGQLDKLATN